MNFDSIILQAVYTVYLSIPVVNTREIGIETWLSWIESTFPRTDPDTSHHASWKLSKVSVAIKMRGSQILLPCKMKKKWMKSLLKILLKALSGFHCFHSLKRGRRDFLLVHSYLLGSERRRSVTWVNLPPSSRRFWWCRWWHSEWSSQNLSFSLLFRLNE